MRVVVPPQPNARDPALIMREGALRGRARCGGVEQGREPAFGYFQVAAVERG